MRECFRCFFTIFAPKLHHNNLCNMNEKEKFYRALRYLIYLVMVLIGISILIPVVLWFSGAK